VRVFGRDVWNVVTGPKEEGFVIVRLGEGEYCRLLGTPRSDISGAPTLEGSTNFRRASLSWRVNSNLPLKPMVTNNTVADGYLPAHRPLSRYVVRVSFASSRRVVR